MAILNRVSRLIKADLNAVLDQLEEPVDLLRQSIRDMQDALAEQRRHQRLSLQKLNALSKQQQNTAQRIEQIDRQLDTCLAADDDELARPLVRRKLQTLEQQSVLAQQIEQLTNRQAELDRQIAVNETRVGEMQEKLAVMTPSGTTAMPTAEPDAASITDNDVQIALMREKQARDEQAVRS